MIDKNEKLYNHSVKLQWIDYYITTSSINEKSVKKIFLLSKNIEYGEGKDLCNFDQAEIALLYESVDAKSKERLCVLNSMYKAYTTWCICNNVEICYTTYNYFQLFDIISLKKFISSNLLEKKFISYDTLRYYVDELINPCDQLFLVLLYKGIKGKQLTEVINLNISQIDNNILHLSTGRDIVVDDYILDLIMETDRTYSYITFNEVTEEQRVWELFGDNVMKNVKSARTDSLSSIYHRYTNKLVKFQKQFNNSELTINRIWRAGMLGTLLSKANELGISMEKFVVGEDAAIILEQYEFNHHPTKIISIFSEYFDYIK